MSNNPVQIFIRFVLFVLLQVLILNNFQIMGAINPKAYVLFILALPYNQSRSLKLILAFAIGLTIDIFENSGGIHASASVFLAFILPFLYRIISSQGGLDLSQINISTVEKSKYFIYIAVGVFLHHLWLFFMEAFSFNNVAWVLKETTISSIATFFIILIIALLSNRKPDRI